jgi:hypothetical protein
MQVTEPVAIPFLARETWEFLKSFIDLELKQLLFLQAIATLATKPYYLKAITSFFFITLNVFFIDGFKLCLLS